MHGDITTVELRPETASSVNNVRMYMMAAIFKSCRKQNVNPFLREGMTSKLKQMYRKNLTEMPDMIMENYADATREDYKDENYRGFLTDESERNIETSGMVYDPITFDKMLQEPSDITEVLDRYMDRECSGIRVISVHKKLGTTKEGFSPSLELVYPLDTHENKDVDLTSIRHIQDFYDYIHEDMRLPHIPLLANPTTDYDNPSYLFRNMGRNLIRLDGEDENTMIHRMFTNVGKDGSDSTSKYEPYRTDGKIVYILISQLSQMIKNLLGDDIYINIHDYSCSTMSASQLRKVKASAYPRSSVAAMRESVASSVSDIEKGRGDTPSPTFFGKRGGARRRRRTRKGVRTRTKSKTNRRRSRKKKNKKSRKRRR